MLLTPPHAPDAEKSILSTAIQEPKRLTELIHHGITDKHFYLPANGILFSLLLSMKTSGFPIDLVTIHQKLEDSGDLEQIGGASALVEISRAASSLAHFSYYIEIVKEKFGLREIIINANDAIEKAYANDGYADVSAMLKKGLQATDLAALPVLEVPFKEEVRSWTHSVKDKIENPDITFGADTGLSETNTAIRGLRVEEFIVISAKPSQGKTALMLQMGLSSAAAGFPLLVVSYEMSRDQIMDRWCSCTTQIDMSIVQQPDKATDDEKARMRHFAKTVQELNITIKGTEVRELSLLVAFIEKWTAKNPRGIIVLDYIQLVKVKGSRSKVEEIENTTREIKDLTQRCQCCIIAGSQLNKEGVVKGSESIWEDASILFRIVVDKKTNCPKSLHLKKNRNGPAGEHYPIQFKKNVQRFIEVEEAE